MTVNLTPVKNGRKEWARAKDITEKSKEGFPERLWKEKINHKAVEQNGDIDKNTWLRGNLMVPECVMPCDRESSSSWCMLNSTLLCNWS